MGFFKCRRECAILQKHVEVASHEFMLSKQCGAPESEQRTLSEEHAARFGEFLAARGALDKMKNSKTNSKMKKNIQMAQPYFDAEDEHREQLEEADAVIARLEECVAAAKARYRGSLQSLETLSNQTHQRRASEAVAPEPLRFGTAPSSETPVASSPGVSGVSPLVLPPSSGPPLKRHLERSRTAPSRVRNSRASSRRDSVSSSKSADSEALGDETGSNVCSMALGSKILGSEALGSISADSEALGSEAEELFPCEAESQLV